MKRIIPSVIAVWVLLCYAGALAQTSPEMHEAPPQRVPLKLLITTYDDHGVIIEDFMGVSGLRSYTVDGPHIQVVLEDGARLVIDDLDDPASSGAVDSERGTQTFAGNLVLEIQRDGRAVSRLTVRQATVLYGRFDDEELLLRTGFGRKRG